MKSIDYIKGKPELIQEIKIKEIKYTGSTIEEVDAHVLVFPRVIFYVSESDEDAVYIFLTKEKMECFLAITLANYFSGEVVRKRVDFDKNMDKYNMLYKRIVLKFSTEKDWTEAIDFYTNKRITDVLGEEDSFCLSKAAKTFGLAFGLDLSNKKINDFLFQALPSVNIQGNGVAWNELCFPAFVNDIRYNEVESNLSGCRLWYNESFQNELYGSFVKYSAKIKLCSYSNKFTQSDISLFKSIITGK